MAAVNPRTPYICRRCVHNISHRPLSPQKAKNADRWRPKRSTLPPEQPLKVAKYFNGPGPKTKTVRTIQRENPSFESTFKLSKQFNRDRKQRPGNAPNAPVSALNVDLEDGNHVPRSRHRYPSSTPRTRLASRKVKAYDPERGPAAIGHFLVDDRPLPAHIKRPSILHYSTARRSLRESNDEGNLIPSTPTPTPSARTWGQEPVATKTTLHFGTLEDWNWYWETLPPTISQKVQGNHFFTKNTHPKFLRSIANFRLFPESDVPEVAFVGRSNVGKSSLLNAIVNADIKSLLARTSSTPGFTKTMNLYGVGPGNGVTLVKSPSGHDKIVGLGGITIVDMPGYGEGSLAEWGEQIMKYLQGRKQLRRVFVLIDAQHGIKDKDRSLLASLRLGGIPHQIILSKLDKIYLPKAREIKRYNGKSLAKLKPKGSLNSLKLAMDAVRGEIQPPVGGGALGEILSCSSDVLIDGKRLGIDAVRFAVLQAVGFRFRVDGGGKKEPRVTASNLKRVKL